MSEFVDLAEQYRKESLEIEQRAAKVRTTLRRLARARDERAKSEGATTMTEQELREQAEQSRQAAKRRIEELQSMRWFEPQLVANAITSCDGSKRGAAQLLGCSAQMVLDYITKHEICRAAYAAANADTGGVYPYETGYPAPAAQLVAEVILPRAKRSATWMQETADELGISKAAVARYVSLSPDCANAARRGSEIREAKRRAAKEAAKEEERRRAQPEPQPALPLEHQEQDEMEQRRARVEAARTRPYDSVGHTRRFTDSELHDALILSGGSLVDAARLLGTSAESSCWKRDPKHRAFAKSLRESHAKRYITTKPRVGVMSNPALVGKALALCNGMIARTARHIGCSETTVRECIRKHPELVLIRHQAMGVSYISAAKQAAPAAPVAAKPAQSLVGWVIQLDELSTVNPRLIAPRAAALGISLRDVADMLRVGGDEVEELERHLRPGGLLDRVLTMLAEFECDKAKEAGDA